MKRHVIGALVFLGGCCAGADSGAIVQAQTRSDWTSYGGRVEPAISPIELEAERHGALVVAPDRALVTIEARFPHPDRATATRRARELADELVSRATEGCDVRLWAIAPAAHEDGFVAAATLALDVDLRADGTPAARQEHLEACVQAFHDLPRDRFEGLELRLSEPLITVDDPGAHRDALLDRRLAVLRAVAARTETPAQFRADALRCTSSGEVTIAHRSLHGVRLAVDLSCDREAAAAETVAVATAR